MERRDAIAVRLSARSAVVALGAGHADAQTLPLRRSGGRIRFTIPGRPALASLGVPERQAAARAWG